MSDPPLCGFAHTGIGIRLKLGTQEGKEQIEGWTESKDYVEWVFQISKPGRFKIMAEVALEKDSTMTCSVEGQSRAQVSLEGTGGLETFQTRELGTLEIKDAGTHALTLRPVKQEVGSGQLGAG
ncbi:MAG: hypothetical protein HC901_04745 [Bdellovibrionaceae bacterium]|nr:hypothetical protein [Pseudobdellovibrionaceae bacterium]